VPFPGYQGGPDRREELRWTGTTGVGLKDGISDSTPDEQARLQHSKTG
jgi:hypothetical protein